MKFYINKKNISTKLFFYLIMFFAVFFINSCKKDSSSKKTEPEPEYIPKPYTIQIPKNFPTKIYIPEDNPMTVEGIELGRLLFYDGRLGGRTHLDSLMTCATCHKQQYAFENGTGYAYGVTGIRTPHVMLPMINLVWNPNTLLWNGKVKQIEDLILMGIIAPHEMNSDTNRVLSTLKNIPMYPPLFKKAFGSETITIKNISKAIAQFIRTLISSNSKFDKYLRGETNLTDQEFNGYVLFTTEQGADCFHCHGAEGNPLFTTNLFYNNAKDTVFTDIRDRYAVTKDIMDKGAYKATTLRNIEYTGPYMHDGRFATLNDVVNFYSSGLVESPYVSPLMHKLPDGGANLNLQQKQDLIAFLKTLTDESFVTNPAFSNPKPAGHEQYFK